MTKEEKIIATAFTGKMFIDGSDMSLLYEYMEKKVGHGVIDLMLASKEFWEELHKACEQDFIDMVSKEEPDLPSNLDEAAEEYANRGISSNSDPYEETIGYQVDKDVFKAVAKWMAGQGITVEGDVEGNWRNQEDAPYEIYVTSDCLPKDAEFKIGDKVIMQIRKK